MIKPKFLFIRIGGFSILRPRLFIRIDIHHTCLAHLFEATYLALVVDCATTVCHLVDQVIGFPNRVMTCPDVDFRVSSDDS